MYQYIGRLLSICWLKSTLSSENKIQICKIDLSKRMVDSHHFNRTAIMQTEGIDEREEDQRDDNPNETNDNSENNEILEEVVSLGDGLINWVSQEL